MSYITWLTGARTRAAAAGMRHPFPQPVQPEQDPFAAIPQPGHISSEAWQTSYYDATSSAPMGAFVQLGAGPCDVATGQLKDGDFPSTGLWQQV